MGSLQAQGRYTVQQKWRWKDVGLCQPWPLQQALASALGSRL